MKKLAQHLARTRDNALEAAEALLVNAGDEPAIGDVLLVDSYLTDADRAQRLFAFVTRQNAMEER